MGKMDKFVILHTTRTHYSAKEAAIGSLTVEELIDILREFDMNAPVVFSNDNGYTYGNIKEYNIGVKIDRESENYEEEDENYEEEDD